MIQNNSVYIVSGYMRSGTSMMMKCLRESGMDVVYNRNKDKILNERYSRKDYAPNPEGFYELGRKDFARADFPEHCNGKLIKMLHWRLESLPEFNYRIIFMLRDPKEIEVSYLKMFRRRPPFVLQKYDEMVNEILDTLKKRSDMDIITVRHSDVINRPEEIFSMLEQKKWPLKNIEKAASAVNRSLYRSKGNDLETVRKSIPGLRTDLPECLNKKICLDYQGE